MKNLFIKSKRSSIPFLFFLFFISIVKFNFSQNYCIPRSTARFHYIDRFKLGTINNTSEFSESGYQDFSAIETDLIEGESYIFSIRSRPNLTALNRIQEIYIDLNNDSDFLDDGELIFEGSPTTNHLRRGTISLPDTFVEGETRLRVFTKLPNDFNMKEPCVVGLGETEDYTVRLIKLITLTSLSPSIGEVQEGDYFVFDVGLDAIANEDIVIKVSTESITTTPEDFSDEVEYSLDNGENWIKNDEDPSSFIFPIGFRELKFRLATIEDDLFESNDSLRIKLTSELPYLVLEQDSALGIIENNDVLISTALSLEAEPKATEGELMTFTATLSNPTNTRVTIDQVKLIPISADSSDYNQASIAIPITFEPGNTIKTFTIETIEDNLSEGDEQFVVAASKATNAEIESGIVIATIIDNEQTPLIPYISLEAESEATEGELMTFTATLSNPTNTRVTIDQVKLIPISADSSDYNQASIAIPITFEPGNTIKTFTIETIEDNLSEGDEQFVVAVSKATNAEIESGVVIATIIDNEQTPLIPYISLEAESEATEGELMTFTATLSNPTNTRVTIDQVKLIPISADSSDYNQASIAIPITFEPGNTIKTFTIETIEDNLSEGDEQFVVAVSKATNAEIESGVVIATIIDNDSRGEAGQVAIYPNPFRDHLNIKIYNNACRHSHEIIDIFIYDLNGNIVFQRKFPLHRHRPMIRIHPHELMRLRTGVYFLRIHTRLWTKTYKIIKE